jgi:DNA repair exonuclease SbcCD ATPase subunit
MEDEIRALEADIEDLKAGADYTPCPNDATRNPGQLWAYLIGLEPNARIRVLGQITAAGERAAECFVMDHAGLINSHELQGVDQRREIRNLRERLDQLEQLYAADIAQHVADHRATANKLDTRNEQLEEYQRERTAFIAERDHAVAIADRYRASLEHAIRELTNQLEQEPKRPPCNVVSGSKMGDTCGCGHMVAAHRRQNRRNAAVLGLGPFVCDLCTRPE